MNMSQEFKSYPFETIDSSDEADSSFDTLNSSVEQVDLSQRISITSFEDLRSESFGKSKNRFDSEKSTHEKIENIIRKKESDQTDPRHSKPTNCDLIELQKVKQITYTFNFFCFCLIYF